MIECASFRAIDGGVLLFDESAEESEDEDEDREAVGFIPHHQLRFVLSEELNEQLAPTQPQQQQQGMQQQTMQQQPSQGQAPPQQMGGPGPAPGDVPPGE